MTKHRIGLVSFAVAACVFESGCAQDDTGQSSYYGTGGTGTIGAGGDGSGATAPMTGSGGGPMTGTGSGTSAAGGNTAAGGSNTAAGGKAPMTGAGGTATGATTGSGGAMSGGGTAGAAGGNGAGGAMPSGPCDLTGRWIETTHYVSNALGADQTAHSYHYLEIGKQGDGYVVTKGLYCGDFAHGTGLVNVEVHFDASNAEVFKHIDLKGRTATSVPSAGGCDVHFAKQYVIRGATVAYYLQDPTRPMPTEAQKASADGATPGWEDWDKDGKPGITGSIQSTAVNGKIFTAPRRWDEPKGTVSDVKSTFTLSLAGWGQAQNVMQTDPADNPILLTAATIVNDPARHFAGFARLAADQATGDDAAICSAIMKLAPTLTADANKI